MMKQFTVMLGLIVLLAMGGCDVIINSDSMEGNGIKGSKTSDFSSFENLEISGSFDVKLIPSQEHKVVVRADENLLPYVVLKQSGNTLEVKFKNNTSIRTRSKIEVDIFMKTLSVAELAGSSEVKTTDRFTNAQGMEFTIAGSGNIDVDIKTPKVETNIGGSGKAKLKGETKVSEVNIGGSGDYLAEKLLSEDAEVSIAGSGNAELFASRKLDVSIAGSGNVRYRGTPTVVKSIAGSGSIMQVND